MASYAFYASQRSYSRHILPIAAELRLRGHDVTVWGQTPGDPWGDPLRSPDELGPTVIVASALDAQRVGDGRRAVVYVEHGAGQTYTGLAEDRLRFGYSGGPGMEMVNLFLCPSERVAGRWRTAYPQAAVEVVGCPALDRHAHRGEAHARRTRGVGQPPTVAVTQHWRCGVCPETEPALPHFMAAIPALRDRLARDGYELVGHAHPRVARRLSDEWRALGVRYEPDPDVILATSSLLIADTTSLMYEAAAVGLPVLALNAPTYRRDVEHGLRFWSEVPGLQCDRPEDLDFMVDLALEDGPEAQKLRRIAAHRAYAVLDGEASVRAADAIENCPITPMRGAPRMAVTQSHEAEFLERLRLLGATDDEILGFKAVWDAATAETRDQLRRMNDVRLAAEIRDARDEDA